MNKNDKRSLKTKKAIINAFTKLMMEKDISNITVKELAEAADIHRVTFYSHFEDVYDLFNYVQNEMLKNIESVISSSVSYNYQNTFKQLIELIYEKQNISKMLLCGPNSIFYQKQLCNLIEQKYLEISLYEEHERQIPELWYYIGRYHTQGNIAAIVKWAEEDFMYPKEKLITLLTAIDLCLDKVFYEDI